MSTNHELKRARKSLTVQEPEVMPLVVSGMFNQQMASEIGASGAMVLPRSTCVLPIPPYAGPKQLRFWRQVNRRQRDTRAEGEFEHSACTLQETVMTFLDPVMLS